jgi:hypothetical protein
MFKLTRPYRLLCKVIPVPPRSSEQLRKALGNIAAEAKQSADASREVSNAIADKITKLSIERAEARGEANAADNIAQTLEERGLL